jgi:hypothetical protein
MEIRLGRFERLTAYGNLCYIMPIFGNLLFELDNDLEEGMPSLYRILRGGNVMNAIEEMH